MIAKRAPREKGTSSMSRLVRYMVAAQGGVDPTSWTRTADYILATGPKTGLGERVESFRVTNCGTDDPADATLIIEASQRGALRSKADKTYHLIFSFPPGERPSQDALHHIEDELCASIGLESHHRISAVHIDKDHYHVHVAINKVTPDGRKVVEPYQDLPRLMRACDRLEIQHGLQRTNHGNEKEPTHERQRERPERPGDQPDPRFQLGERGERDTRFREYLRECYRSNFGGWEFQAGDGLRELSGGALVSDDAGSSVLVSDHAAGHVVKGAAPDANHVRWAGTGDRGIGGPAGAGARAVEVRAGVETLAGYVACEVAPALLDALTWQEAHDALAAHGLDMKKRGAGLVLGDAGLDLWCKASSVHRNLSLGALEQTLGPFEADARSASAVGQRAAPADRPAGYSPRPVALRGESAALYKVYQLERAAARQRREQGLAAIRERHARARQDIDRWSAAQKMQLAVQRRAVKGPQKRVLGQLARSQATGAKAQAAQQAAVARQALFAATRMAAWNDWLADRARAGHADALGVLRGREDRNAQTLGSLFSPSRSGRAAADSLAEARREVRGNGSTVYRSKDGGAVVDRGGSIVIERNTPAACLVALTVIEARFPGQALDMKGQGAVAQILASLAGSRGAGVRFADPTLEAIRTGASRASSSPPAVSDGPDSVDAPERNPAHVLREWIDRRNDTMEKISSIVVFREWQAGDAGEGTYQGKRTLGDGTKVLLVQRGDDILVKPATPTEISKSASWPVGSTVTMDAGGYVAGRRRGRGR